MRNFVKIILMNKHKFIANFLVVGHFLWIVLLIGGTGFVFYNTWYFHWHLTIVSATLLLNLFLGYCPLTFWEEKMRRKIKPDFNHNGSFIATYIEKITGIIISERQMLAIIAWIKFGVYVASITVFLIKK